MLAQPIHLRQVKVYTSPKLAIWKARFGRLLRWTLFLVFVGAVEMILLTSVARLAEASVPPVIRDTRSELTADYSPWEPTEFQPVKPGILQTFFGPDGSEHVPGLTN